MIVNGVNLTKAQVRVEVAKDVIRSLPLLVRLTNKWEFGGFEEHWTGLQEVRASAWEILEEKLHKIFTPFQIDLIETAFEGYNCTNLANNRAVIGRAISFGSKHYDSTSRLRAIMKNIIKNNGTFKP